MPSYHILIVDNMLSVEVPTSKPIPEKRQEEDGKRKTREM